MIDAQSFVNLQVVVGIIATAVCIPLGVALIVRDRLHGRHRR